jgi:hypothetical protein
VEQHLERNGQVRAEQPRTVTRHRARGALLGAVLFLLGGAVLLGGVALLGGTDRDPVETLPAGHFTERLLGCLPTEETETAYLEAGTSGCLRETLLAAAELGNLQTARLDLGELVEARPWLHNYCHLAEHQVGSRIMDDPMNVPELLLAHPGNTCSWGIGHGLLETFGAARPEEKAWNEVIATCRSLRSMPDPYPEVYSLCADGIGHAAWDHHRDLVGAVPRCEALLEESAVSACTTGILMQKYRPAETGKQPALSVGELDAYCQQRWPSSSRASLEGCATGLGYVLSLSLVGDFLSGELATDGGEASQLAAARSAAEELAAAMEVCGTLTGLAETCKASVLVNLPRHLVPDQTAWRSLCGALTERGRATCETL